MSVKMATESLLEYYATIFRDIFTKQMDISDEGRLRMAIAQLRALLESVNDLRRNV
jgi:hypothetical protein